MKTVWVGLGLGLALALQTTLAQLVVGTGAPVDLVLVVVVVVGRSATTPSKATSHRVEVSHVCRWSPVSLSGAETA